MSNLKELRNRIGSVKSTRKITQAMKMVAAAKLRQAQKRAENAQPYSKKINKKLEELLPYIEELDVSFPLIDGRRHVKTHLLIVISGERGLCAGFNHGLIKIVRRKLNTLSLDGKDGKILCIGKKGYETLKRSYADRIVGHYPMTDSFAKIHEITQRVLRLFHANNCDSVDVVYNEFKSTLSQKPTRIGLIPFASKNTDTYNPYRDESFGTPKKEVSDGLQSFEPDPVSLLQAMIPAAIAAKLYALTLESAAGEQAARMAAMDGATRNAGDLIDSLTTVYNRERQAHITREITEIVSAAEAL